MLEIGCLRIVVFSLCAVLLNTELFQVSNLIDKTAISGSEPKLPLVRVKVK